MFVEQIEDGRKVEGVDGRPVGAVAAGGGTGEIRSEARA